MTRTAAPTKPTTRPTIKPVLLLSVLLLLLLLFDELEPDEPLPPLELVLSAAYDRPFITTLDTVKPVILLAPVVRRVVTALEIDDGDVVLGMNDAMSVSVPIDKILKNR